MSFHSSHVSPSDKTLQPSTVCVTSGIRAPHAREALSGRRDPHHARTAWHGAHQHAHLSEHVRIGPKIMHRQQRTSAQWPKESNEQCKGATARFCCDQKRVAPSTPPPHVPLRRLLSARRSRCRLSKLREQSARAEAVRSEFVARRGVNGARRARERCNRKQVSAPAAATLRKYGEMSCFQC